MKLKKTMLSQWKSWMIFPWLMYAPSAIYAQQSTSFNAQQPYILSLDSTLTNVLYFPNPLRTYSTNVTLTAAASLTINFWPPFADTNYIVTAPNGLVGSTVTLRTITNFTLGFTSATLTGQTIEGSCIHQYQWNDAPVTVVTNTTNPVVSVNPPALGGAAITSLPVVRSLRSDATAFVGWKAMTTTSMHITQIGRWVVAGDSGTHILYVFSGPPPFPLVTPFVLGSVVINTSGAATNQMDYVTLPTPIAVASGTTIAVMSSETSGGDNWYDFETYSWTGDFTSIAPADAVTVGGTISFFSSNESAGPVNILYTVP